jgi:chromate transporter
MRDRSATGSSTGFDRPHFPRLPGHQRDRLRGRRGAIAAVIGICLPGGSSMFVVGLIYRAHGDHGFVTAALKGVVAASVGLILATAVQLSRRSLSQRFDILVIALTMLAVNRLRQSVLTTLVVVRLLGVLWHCLRRAPVGAAP